MLTQVSVYVELSHLVARSDCVRDVSVRSDVHAGRQHSQHGGSHGHVLGDGDGVVPPLEDWSVVVHVQHQDGQINLRGRQETGEGTFFSV